MTAAPAVRPWTHRPWVWALLLLTLVGAAAALRAASRPAAPPPDRYLTQPVDRGDIARTVHATGSLAPLLQVQVGTQVSGTIAKLRVDFNSPVKAGQLLAELDTRTLDADLASAQAALSGARASQALASQRFTRAEGLHGQGFISRDELELARSNLASASAQVEQSQAQLTRAQTNRRMAEIRSPVDGVVVAREVSEGQVVAASFNTPVLFRIAQDLRAMQIEAQVSEADIGLLREGQPVEFNVDAFPGQTFTGRVEQIRNNNQVQQNVVTYTVIAHLRNEDLRLRPGMTAYLRVEVAKATQALRVPNAALRYRPSGSPNVASQVWRLKADGQIEPIALQPGLDDKRHTEALDKALREGDRLVIGERGAVSGPQAPKFF